jgi:hypothetical protein
LPLRIGKAGSGTLRGTSVLDIDGVHGDASVSFCPTLEACNRDCLDTFSGVSGVLISVDVLVFLLELDVDETI